MFFPFMDYDIVSFDLSGSDSTSTRTIYTTSFPCLLFLEIEPGRIAGFNGDKSCYFDIEYTGDRDVDVRTYIWRSNQFTGDSFEGTNVAYCPRSGVPVRFFTGDDDYSGTVRLHILRLPTSRQILP